MINEPLKFILFFFYIFYFIGNFFEIFRIVYLPFCCTKDISKTKILAQEKFSSFSNNMVVIYFYGSAQVLWDYPPEERFEVTYFAVKLVISVVDFAKQT